MNSNCKVAKYMSLVGYRVIVHSLRPQAIEDQRGHLLLVSHEQNDQQFMILHRTGINGLADFVVMNADYIDYVEPDSYSSEFEVVYSLQDIQSILRNAFPRNPAMRLTDGLFKTVGECRDALVVHLEMNNVPVLKPLSELDSTIYVYQKMVTIKPPYLPNFVESPNAILKQQIEKLIDSFHSYAL